LVTTFNTKQLLKTDKYLKRKDGEMIKWALTKDNLPMLVEKLKTLDFTKRWRVTITDAKLNRSLEQNERLWELYTSIGNHLGIDKQQVHELMSYRLLRYQTEIAGMPVELIKSTTKLTTSEMTEYQQQIEVWGQTMGWGWDY
jgi:HD-GYP domain-containing protein (c-di-GMP phosphodiesterase class II)